MINRSLATSYELDVELRAEGFVPVGSMAAHTAETSVAVGVTPFDGLLAGPGPTPLVATTVKVYAVPFDRPVTTQLRLSVVHVWPQGEAVAT
jgi:hypothetical protein